MGAKPKPLSPLEAGGFSSPLPGMENVRLRLDHFSVMESLLPVDSTSSWDFSQRWEIGRGHIERLGLLKGWQCLKLGEELRSTTNWVLGTSKSTGLAPRHWLWLRRLQIPMDLGKWLPLPGFSASSGKGNHLGSPLALTLGSLPQPLQPSLPPHSSWYLK